MPSMETKKMTTGKRTPSWKEKEKNKKRERKRRAIAANIFAGLRKYGNYNLPKHCDNNQVLKALCEEAGWTVELDGTTYRKGCKPMEPLKVSVPALAGPYSSYQASPFTSYNPSPISSSLGSPSSSYNNNDANSLIPWLKNLSSNPVVPSKPPRPNLSISAPVTPPASSSTTSSPRFNAKADEPSNWLRQYHIGCASPSLASLGPSAHAFSLVPPSCGGAFGFLKSGAVSEGSSRMLTPSQSGSCSPVMTNAGGGRGGDVCVSDEFAFGVVKAWEGETIHEECTDGLELTLGNSMARAHRD